MSIENIKSEVKYKLNPFIKELFPDNKIPIYISPIDIKNSDYITWSEYNKVDKYGDLNDNYCRPNEVGEYQYPTNDDIKSCDNYIDKNVLNELNLNKFITNSYNNIKIEEDIDDKKIINNLHKKINEYEKTLKTLDNEKKILNNYKNIHNVINIINKKINNKEYNTKNKVNINNDSYNDELYNYLPFNYYIYTIIALVTIILILQFTIITPVINYF